MSSTLLVLLLFAVLPLTFAFLSHGPVLRQGNLFLLSYDQPIYSRQIIHLLQWITWSCAILVLLLNRTFTLSPAHLLQSFVLLIFSLNLIALDAQERWLPLCFTNSFWLAGLLLTLLPGAAISPYAAVYTSLAAFLLLSLVYRILARKQPDALGLGDVHLLAGLCAWLPLLWLSGALVLYLLITVSLFGRKSPHPLAPWLLPAVILIHLIHPILATEGNIYVE